MTRYIAIIDYDQDEDVFGAYFPDAPGCTAMGKTQDEVIANATEALSEWAADERAAGNELARARSYVQLHQSKEYALGQNGMVAFIPLILETGKVIRANISIDAGLLTSIDEEATRQGISRSAYLAAAARERIRSHA